MEIPEDFIDISPNNDKGVCKKIIKEGIGEAHPRTGANVFVHYVGTFYGGEKDGEKFDSSRDRKEQFSFVLGEGQVIKGWDTGVGTMKKNEICELICSPEFAYGSSGNAGIPANSTLKFEVELFDWKGKDISPDKDGSLLQTVVTEGAGWETPKDCALVKILLKTKVGDSVVDERNVEFEIGDGESADLAQGVELGVKKMKKGEISLFEIGPNLAYGSKGNPEKNIPANSVVVCEVKLIEFNKVKDSYSIDTSQEKFQCCEEFKNKATKKFQANKIVYATKLYDKAASYIEFDGDFKDDEKEARNKLLLSLRLNLALCYIKRENVQSAITECEKALEIDESNEKGLYRLGLALIMKGEYEAAKKAFKRVYEINGDNKQALNQIRICDQNIQEILKKEKQLYKTMFSKFGQSKSGGDTAANNAAKKEENVAS